ncbi:MAG: beta-ketoacyl-[acyl-carrier-protein] synthase family protein [Sedimentisphaerales bacterium]|nr:beta-ketoacyl-[acyl-carrier-protein] synthase family protein [Sedimentisphaerales bacterium]
MSSYDVAITGLGSISPLGTTAEQMWQGISQGSCGIRPITSFDPVGFSCKFAGQVPDFNIRQCVPKTYRKAVKLFSRDIELAVAAAHGALNDSGLVTKGIDPENINVDPTRFAVNIGAGLISCDLVEIAPAAAASVNDGKFDIRKWGKEGLELVTPLWLLKYLPNMLACHIGIIHDIQGPSNTITCAEASAHLAIAEAAELIARGSSDIALAGGAEAKVNPIVMIRQCLIKRAVNSDGEPASACRPFDADARGSVFGEAAAIVTLENTERAKRRDANIYAQIAGLGQSNSINVPYEKLEADGKGIQIAIEKALADAQIGPDDLGLIVPHGTGIADDDLAEAKAIEAALGKAVSQIPVLPTKSMLSNTGAAGGALDIIVAAQAIKKQRIPAARNCDKKMAGCNLNIIKEPVEKEIRYVLCCSYTYGGQTAAIILKNNSI